MNEEPPFRISLGKNVFSAKGALAMVLVTLCFLALMGTLAIFAANAPQHIAGLVRWMFA